MVVCTKVSPPRVVRAYRIELSYIILRIFFFFCHPFNSRVLRMYNKQSAALRAGPGINNVRGCIIKRVPRGSEMAAVVPWRIAPTTTVVRPKNTHTHTSSDAYVPCVCVKYYHKNAYVHGFKTKTGNKKTNLRLPAVNIRT